MSQFALWGAIAILLVGLCVSELITQRSVREFLTRGRRSQRFWVRHLIAKGPMPLSQIPPYFGKTLPVDKFIRLAMIEVEPGTDPIIQASGYGKLLYRELDAGRKANTAQRKASV